MKREQAGLYEVNQGYAARDLQVLHKPHPPEHPGCLLNNAREHEKDQGEVLSIPLDWALTEKTGEGLCARLSFVPKREVAKLAERLGFGLLCDHCFQPIKLRDAQLDYTYSHWGATGTDLRLVHPACAGGRLGSAHLPLALAKGTVGGLRRLLTHVMDFEVERLARRLKLPRAATHRAARKPVVRATAVRCGKCQQPILNRQGNLEWVELPDGTVRDRRMVHKWTCVAKRSVEYAKDGGEVRWIPLSKALAQNAPLGTGPHRGPGIRTSPDESAGCEFQAESNDLSPVMTKHADYKALGDKAGTVGPSIAAGRCGCTLESGKPKVLRRGGRCRYRIPAGQAFGVQPRPPLVRRIMALEKELETYRAKLPELKDSEGKFVLIHGDTVVGVYTSYEDAIKDGYGKFGLTPFLVKQIQALERAQFVTRLADPCGSRHVA